MEEQIAHRYRQTANGQRIQRQSLLPHQIASRHRVGHQAGLHPEDTPFQSSELSDYRTQDRSVTSEYDLEEDEEYDTTRPHSSARRYGEFTNGQVFQKGNKRFVVHYDYPKAIPPRRQHIDEAEQKPHIRFHWLVYAGIALFIMIAGFVAISSLGSWWQVKQDDWHLGNPRTFQTDANVGHGTPQNPMSHFIAINLHNTIDVIEIPGGDASKAHIYTITTLQDGSEDTPVILSFRDINADGKVDLLVEIGDPSNQYTIFLLNNGTSFVSKL